MNIQVLDQNTINKIAAGEVIERPASVVKELLENAIDAGATAVTVEIRDGGISLIRVTDNGCGIEKEEIAIAFLRHATSKIKSVEDLFTVASLGFRGEALSSIAAVSQVEVITKVSKDLTGTRYRIEGGIELGIEEVGAPEGTTFLARNLFFNTPVRRNFLKTPQTEGSHVADLVEKIALSHPEVSIRLIQNNQNKLHTSGNHNLKDMIYTVFGREIAGNLLKVDCETKDITITGFIGKPVIARNNRNYENYYINGRYIKSSVISKAIEEAYRAYMMQHKYPFTLLHFTINPELLDVNVHPTKMELRFQDAEMVFRLVKEELERALQQKELIPKVTLVKEEKLNHVVKEEKTQYQVPKFLQKPQIPREKPQMEVKPQVEVTPQIDLFEEKFLTLKAREKHKLIGQLFKTYWLIEFQEQLYVVDQHAAHEKVLYEKTMKSLKGKEHTCQQINPPIIISLSSTEELLLKKYWKYFEGIGFEMEPFGGKEYAFRGVPGNLFAIAKKELLLQMIDGLSEDSTISNPDIIFEKVAMMSCKAAVKGNQNLSAMEADRLIEQLLDLENPYACPHGRPTMISMTKQELERKFKRIV